MKRRFLTAVGIVVAAAAVGGATAYTVLKFNGGTNTAKQTAVRVERVADGDFAGGGNHFTAFTQEGYPDLTYAAENAVRGVVGVIKTEEIAQTQVDPFSLFFGVPQSGRQSEPTYRERISGGSGVIISSDGYIVTNHHVVENASKLTVKLYDGTTYDAKLIGTDDETEIALLRIEAGSDLHAIPFGSSDALRLGEWVLAIGNPYQLTSTVTAGIVSAKARSLGAIQTSSGGGIESFIQTDAAVNPGNSGGALVNTRGELVGINTLIQSPTGSYAGYSFAVPSTIVRKVVTDLKEYGVVQRAFIGIVYQVINDEFIQSAGKETGITEVGGIYVTEVPKDGAAYDAGVRKGDVITEIDGLRIVDGASVSDVISRHRPGDTIKISAKRDGKVKQFEVVLRNKAGKSELMAKESFDAMQSLGGEFENINLSDKQKKELGIRGGIRVKTIARNGILARARVQQGYIISHINGKEINSVNDLYRITEKITSIDGVYPNGRAISYSLVE